MDAAREWDIGKILAFARFPGYSPVDTVLVRKGGIVEGGFGNSALGCVEMIPEFAPWDETFPDFLSSLPVFFPYLWIFLALNFPTGNSHPGEFLCLDVSGSRDFVGILEAQGPAVAKPLRSFGKQFWESRNGFFWETILWEGRNVPG